MSGFSCACGFTANSETLRTFSPDWYRAHRAHHLDVFPDVDRQTHDNFAALIAWAETRDAR